MPEVSTLDAVLEATTVAQEAPEQDEEQEDEGQDEEQVEAPEEKDDPQLNTLLRKCEHAFTKGNKGLLLSRVECGKWCHAVYVLRAGQNHKDRSSRRVCTCVPSQWRCTHSDCPHVRPGG